MLGRAGTVLRCTLGGAPGGVLCLILLAVLVFWGDRKGAPGSGKFARPFAALLLAGLAAVLAGVAAGYYLAGVVGAVAGVAALGAIGGAILGVVGATSGWTEAEGRPASPAGREGNA
jgi:hypothetical protein